jgi:hypothetical protein
MVNIPAVDMASLKAIIQSMGRSAQTGSSSSLQVQGYVVRRRVIVIVVVVALILAGVMYLFGVPGTKYRGPLGKPVFEYVPGAIETPVTADGFKLELQDVTISAPAGVAPEGVTARLETVDQNGQIPTYDDGFEQGSPLFDISFADASQPTVPVTVTWPVPDNRQDEEGLAFVTRDSETGEWNGMPVTITDGVASVTMEHFSWGVFGWTDDLANQIATFMKQLMGIDYPEPDNCDTESAEFDERIYSVTADAEQIWPCIKIINGSIEVSIYSRNGLFWHVKPISGDAVAQRAEAPMEVGPAVTLAAYHTLFGVTEEETLLVPGGSNAITLNPGVTQTSVKLEGDPGFWALNILLTALGSALDIVGASAAWKNLADNAGAVECFAKLAGSFDDPLGNLGQVFSGTLGCLKATGLLTGIVGFFVSCVTSLIPLIISGIQGIIEEVRSMIDGPAPLTVTSESITAEETTEPVPENPPADQNDGSEEFEIGTRYSGKCIVAWPTAPTITSTAIQMTMDCSGVPDKYMLTVVIYGDPTLNVTPTTGQMAVTGVVVDFAENQYGYTMPIIQADTITLS